MSFDKLTDFAITEVLSAALMGNLDSLTKCMHQAHAQMLYESGTST